MNIKPYISEVNIKPYTSEEVALTARCMPVSSIQRMLTQLAALLNSREAKDAAMREVISNLGEHMEGYSHDPKLVEYVTSQLNTLQSAMSAESREKES